MKGGGEATYRGGQRLTGRSCMQGPAVIAQQPGFKGSVKGRIGAVTKLQLILALGDGLVAYNVHASAPFRDKMVVVAVDV
jgi:hypothetical protein